MAASGEIRCPRIGRSDGRRHAWGSPIRALLERTFGRSVVSDPHPHRSRRHHPHSRVGHHPARSEVFALRLLRRSMLPRAADIERIRGCWTEKQAHKRPSQALRTGAACDRTPRFRPFARPERPPNPSVSGALSAKTCARSTLRAYESSPILLTTLPHSCLRKSPLLLTAAAAVGRTDGHRWAVIRPPT